MKQRTEVTVVGSGMAGLTTACLLAHAGKKVTVLERNWLPGGCTSSYWRKGFVFESGATTLVGLSPHMSLQYLLNTIGVSVEAKPLALPMQVWFEKGKSIDRYESLEAWIQEAEATFGSEGQRDFWEFCFQVSEFVWETSLQQTAFPPSTLGDLWYCINNASLRQVRFARYAFQTMEDLLRKYGLLENERFVQFVNEQLMITAQNTLEEVNVLFGATALCYTNYTNYYMPGGLINLVNPLVEYIQEKGGEVLLRHEVQNIEKTSANTYITHASYKGTSYQWESDLMVSALPINNTLPLFSESRKVFQQKKMEANTLSSAFQMGIAFKPHRTQESIHHQIHFPELSSYTGSHSIFLSLSHPDDTTRSDEDGIQVASVSTHIHDLENRMDIDKSVIEQLILDKLEKFDFIKKENIVYRHASTARAWEKWTGRAYGFVGGYPQKAQIKPWQMLDARLDGAGAYICGDTTYPGQGIPGACLSGIIAFEKIRRDYF
ncbi:NAD(P)/FAD-dependent oxidoreductase [Algivirga pacifica]|uniref:C-3',4' desaturase CrtD n=1 Tax=Algivirga pacifica TaxID=1162670 RepID=A0ABP9D4F6_9BACT